MDDQVWGELPDGDLPDDADTADLDEYDELGGDFDPTGLEPGSSDPGVLDSGGPEPGGESGGGALQPLGSLDEPLGTEGATDDFDAALAETAELAADGDSGPDTGSEEGGVQPAAAPSGSEALFGSDPDTVPAGDDGDDGHDFPPDLTDLAGVPEPVDGPPWSDPTVLGSSGPDTAPQALLAGGAPEPAELAAYDASGAPAGGDGWDALLNAEDPATRALAQWWAPS
jgi:hypothetical protein